MSKELQIAWAFPNTWTEEQTHEVMKNCNTNDDCEKIDNDGFVLHILTEQKENKNE